jgi:hypothetical protein
VYGFASLTGANAKAVPQKNSVIDQRVIAAKKIKSQKIGLCEGGAPMHPRINDLPQLQPLRRLCPPANFVAPADSLLW